MIVATVKCEICPNNFPVPGLNARPYEYDTPEEWITLVQGNPQTHVGQHFCSKHCLSQWLMGSSPEVTQPLPTPEQSHIIKRRFLLFDEVADQVEGVQFINGSVTLDPVSDHCKFHCLGSFATWDDFKAAHPECGVQWIDQEVNAAEPRENVKDDANNVKIITEWAGNEDEAKKLGEEKYTYFFQRLHPELVVVKKTVKILRELRAVEGLVGYHIRAECGSDQEVSE